MGSLPSFLGDPAFAPLRGYLEGGQRELKLYQLAGKIADTFDQYTIFRPEMIAQWEEGREEHWQAILWRSLVKGESVMHRGWLRNEFVRRLDAGEVPAGSFPERVTLFGISYLPAFHLDLFAFIARFTKVNVFVLSPCREYWADILPERVLARLSAEERSARIEGNPLLASLGRLGRDFSDSIVELGATSGGEADLYSEATGGTLLASLQNEILNLEGASANDGKITVSREDRSVQIHSCHSPMREAEVLHDQILALFEEMKGLLPRDILVMTPDIETYAPYISAVFDGEQNQRKRIPYSIADRSPQKEGGIGGTLIGILDLHGRRFPVTSVMGILNTPQVLARFGFKGADLDIIRSWLRETSIRWGMDEGERLREGLPPYRENSWMAGLERLLLGCALSGEEWSMYAGILPFDSMEGEGPDILGCFLTFVKTLHGLVDTLGRPRTLPLWQETFRGILDGFFAPNEDDAFEADALRSIFDHLGEVSAASDFTGEVALSVIRSWFANQIESEKREVGFITGKVTFCAMLPMRSIPFRVVALLGMNDNAFPRRNTALGFDLIAREKRRGDRSLRDEDRYLFLEAILSARERLYLSYTGQSIRDNSIFPPSVLVDELLDQLKRHYSDGSPEFPGNIVTKHRLQPFSPAYFPGTSGLVSYSEENCRAVLSRRKGTVSLAPFIAEPLPEPPDDMRTVSLRNLCAFFTQPVRYLVQNRLRIRLDDTAPPLDDTEPFDLDNLVAYNLKEELLEMALSGRDPRELLPAVRARGVLPPSRPGDLLFLTVADEVAEMAERVKGATQGASVLDPLEVNLEIGQFRVVGTLGGIWPSVLLRSRCATLSGRDQVRVWVEHLVLNALAPEGYPRGSVFVAANDILRLQPVKESITILETLLELYWKGLRLPLRFFPRSSFVFAESGKLGNARTKWGGDWYPENDDPYYDLCFGDSDPLDEEFELVSRIVFEPLLRHRGE
jgi:exodeoxyribonuclease V gamma subunit